jgi:integrase/recombinase XerD
VEQGATDRGLAVRPVVGALAEQIGPALPLYVTREQARLIINAAQTMTHRLLLETLWQSGGRVSEVLRLRPCDLDRHEAALVLANLKQRRRALRQKKVYVSPDLVSALAALAKDARIPTGGYFFASQKSHGKPMTRQHCLRLLQRYAGDAGVALYDGLGRQRPVTGLSFRHGAAVHQLRSGIPLSEIQQQLGHARIDTTTIYTRLTDAERRRFADRVDW